MIWFNLAIGLLLIGLAIVLLSRLVFQWRVDQLAAVDPTNVKRQKKLAQIQQRALPRHFRVLFSWGLGILVVLFFFVYSLFQVENQAAQLGKEVTRLKEELLTLKTEQTYYFQGVSLKSYPPEGLAIANEPWESLFTTKEGRKAQGKLEQTIAKKLSPYLGLTTAILTPQPAKKTVTLSLKSDARGSDSAHERLILSQFIEEVSSVASLVQVRYELVTQEKEASVPLVTLVYDRDASGIFQLTEDSDEKAGEEQE